MDYFGGLGSGKGWHSVMLFPTPDFLSELVGDRGVVMFINNSRVPADYRPTPVSDYLVGFQSYYDLVRREESPDWRTVGSLSIGLTHKETSFAEKACKDTRFKLLHPSEPVISVRPCNIVCDGNSFRIGIGIQDETVFGLELSYPKVFSTEREHHEILRSTGDLPNHRLWLKLTEQIKESTRPLVIRNESREIRTRMRISQGAIPVANAHHLLQRFGFKVKANDRRQSSDT